MHERLRLQPHPQGRDTILTFNQLSLDQGSAGTSLLSGPQKVRELYRYFGKAPATLHSHAKCHMPTKGHKFRHPRG